MVGVRGEHEHHNQQNNDKEEGKGWFAILLLQLQLQPYAATCGKDHFMKDKQIIAIRPREKQELFLFTYRKAFESEKD